MEIKIKEFKKKKNEFKRKEIFKSKNRIKKNGTIQDGKGQTQRQRKIMHNIPETLYKNFKVRLKYWSKHCNKNSRKLMNHEPNEQQSFTFSFQLKMIKILKMNWRNGNFKF